MKKIFTFIMMFLIYSSIAYATLTCEGSGQAFVMPEYIETETISIPCVISNENPINVSCVGLIYYEDSLISVYPTPEIVDLVGIVGHIILEDDGMSVPFVVEFKNRDFIHKGTFDWSVHCKDNSFNFYVSTGTFVVEYPFLEGAIVNTMVIFQRDSDKFWALFFLLFFVLALAGILLYLLGVRR